MKIDRHTLWPASIVGALIIMAILLFTLLQLSRTVYPVDMDMRYMQGYQKVDKTYDEIIAHQRQFEAAYQAQIITHRHSDTPIEVPHFRDGIREYEHGLTMGKNRFYLSLNDQQGKSVADAKVLALVSRFDTDDFDQNVQGAFDAKSGRYEFGPFDLSREGRYKIQVRIDLAEGLTAFVEKGVFAR